MITQKLAIQGPFPLLTILHGDVSVISLFKKCRCLQEQPRQLIWEVSGDGKWYVRGTKVVNPAIKDPKLSQIYRLLSCFSGLPHDNAGTLYPYKAPHPSLWQTGRGISCSWRCHDRWSLACSESPQCCWMNGMSSTSQKCCGDNTENGFQKTAVTYGSYCNTSGFYKFPCQSRWHQHPLSASIISISFKQCLSAVW